MTIRIAAHQPITAPQPPETPATTRATRSAAVDSFDGGAMTPTQKGRAEQLTSLFENSNTTLQYGYTEHLHDGRGITAGRAGFTTGTDDARMVIERYTREVPDNPLARYLPRLNQI